MLSDDGGLWTASSSASTRRDRLSRAAPAGRGTVSLGLDASLGFDARTTRLRLRTVFLAGRRLDEAARAPRWDDEVRARLATARLRRFVLFFARLLTLRRARFAMIQIPFKSLTGFG